MNTIERKTKKIIWIISNIKNWFFWKMNKIKKNKSFAWLRKRKKDLIK